jgi:hypothetical protein
MKKFEYKLLEARNGFFKGIGYKELHEQLTYLGSIGWEVVSTVGVVSTGQDATDLLFTLKREIQ